MVGSAGDTPVDRDDTRSRRSPRCFQASSDTLSFRVLGRRMGLRFVCSRVAISFIVVTAGTRKKSSSFPIEFVTKTPDAPHISMYGVVVARAMRRNVVDVGRGRRAWKCA